MSKLAQLKRARVGDPALPALAAGAGKLIGKLILGGVARAKAAKAAAMLAAGAGGGAVTRLATTALQKRTLPVAMSKALAVGGAAGGGMTLAEQFLGAAGGREPVRRRRGRGITAVELRGFRKVSRLLANVGMAPRGLRRPYSARRRK